MILEKIKKYLISKINVNFINIQDNSLLHNHFKKGLTHVKLIIVSNDFMKKKIINRHRMIFSILSEIEKERIYSITLYTYTPVEWEYKKHKKFSISNNCLNK